MLDVYQGYNQIKLAKGDQKKTSFVIEQGLYCYNLMPFGLKDAGATYQRLVNKIFSQQLGRNMEVYVDDILVKSKKRQCHTEDLAECFAQLKKYSVKLNPQKCMFRVEGGKSLGYLVTQRGIEANPDKIIAIRQMKEPRTIKQVQQLADKIASLNQFISRAADQGLLFFKILRNTKNFQWTEECGQAFMELKSYLEQPPLLSKLEDGERLWIYLALSNDATSTVLAREKEVTHLPIYYTSRLLQGAKYEVKEETTWDLYVDGSATKKQAGGGVVLTNSEGDELKFAIRFEGLLSNNKVEYEALLCGLKIAQENGKKDEVIQIGDRRLGSWMDEIRNFLEHNQLPAEIFTSVENPKTNGQTEVSNRIILQNLKTKLGALRSRWVEKIPGVLWAYRTTPHVGTGKTPFSLVYGSEALIPAEIVEPTIRTVGYEEQNNNEARQLDLDLIEEQRDIARMRLENYKRRIIRNYNSNVKERTFQVRGTGTEESGGTKASGKIGTKVGRTLPNNRNTS
ncbi:UNVERIFIED_CONTAM: Retrovirus-related Pol polyprotein from transposon opus [Sesamum latifolium]|uniref:Retrovirus-related Pol polyprotein from transposon opus n=1 Tax=Sesamum latifolium TaxID=2727402 RepID=A0AAW2SUQ8_9LAMI